jgi:predicted DNA-binding transcriptional regulator YafY
MHNRIIKLQQIFATSRGMLVQKSYLLEQLECSESTLKRDIKKLKEQFDVPLNYDRQNHGWRVEKNYQLTGIWFSKSELYSLLVLEQLSENLNQGLIADELLQVKNKISKLLSMSIKDENIADKLRLISIFHRHLDENIFQKIAKSTFESNRIEIDFIDKNQQTTRRILSPQRIVHYKDRWYLDGFCHLRKGIRTFAIDGISNITILEKQAKILSVKELDIVMENSYGMFSGFAKKRAKIHFMPPVSFWIAKEKWHPKQQIKWLKNNVLELQIPYNKEQELVADILRYAGNVKIISPKSLRQTLIQQAEKLLQNNT